MRGKGGGGGRDGLKCQPPVRGKEGGRFWLKYQLKFMYFKLLKKLTLY